MHTTAQCDGSSRGIAVLISVVIPTHNRADLLLEAVASVAAQTLGTVELVVVDDGSSPPVDRQAIEGTFSGPLQLIHHQTALGVPSAKNAGIRAAQGEVIVLLDDDDLLTEDALEVIAEGFSTHPHLDCIFMGVEPFGPYAEGPAASRKAAMDALFQAAPPRPSGPLWLFDHSLFDALIPRVPIDFQRPAARRGAWNVIGPFDEYSLFSESTWTKKAAALCALAVTRVPINHWRIHGKNFGWPEGLSVAAAQRRQVHNEILAGANLLEAVRDTQQTWRRRESALRRHQSQLLFTRAYQLRTHDWANGWAALWQAFRLRATVSQLKLAVRYALTMPRKTTDSRD
ncbi:MAG: glycosyltransferase family 2 protein [Pseudomonadota bacterium]|nr:glycosyltransferase family 2 protein [Pseudomonadota bacterium]